MNNLPAMVRGKNVFNDIIPIAKPDLPDLEDIKKDIDCILKTGMITNHDFVRRFEKTIAAYLGVKYAACVSSGTSGLMLALKSLDLKGEVIIPSFTFSAIAIALKWCGLNLIFADIDRETFNIHPEKIREAITSETSAIAPVHVFGNPCEIDEIKNIAKEFGLKLLFDSAHAFGAKYKSKKIGGFGNAEVFSLTPTKILTTGEGGIVTTNDKNVYRQIILGREYGKTPDYDCKTIGLSARMGEFNAILGLYNLSNINKKIKRRLELFKIYKSELSAVEGISFQKLNPNAECSLKDFAIIVDKKIFGMNRDKLADTLTNENIGWRKYFYPPVHRETINKDLESSKKELPNTDFISKNILNLPFFTSMANDDIVNICNTIKRIKKK